jgi:nicotinamidase-related amidase
VTIDSRTTALLLLDFNQQTCNPQRRPRCVASIPKVKTLLTAARAAGVPVVYSLGGGGKPADIASELTPAANEPVVSSGVDKFANGDLEKILKDKGVTTVIVVGTAAHGAVLYTASGAAMRGMKVILPVDGISAETTYAEQYVAWHLTNAPVISPAMTLTTIDSVRF